MALFEKIIFYLILALAIVIFLKLDKRHSIITRLGIAIVAALVLLLLFMFISAIITIIIVIVLVILLVSLLEKKNISFRKLRKK